MAHPGFIIEQYVCHFLSQWRVGLQPSLTLHAKRNGKIDVSLNLTTSLSSNQNEDQFSTPSFRSSGRGSRNRRRVRRAAAGSSKETHDASISSPVKSDQEQCTSNGLVPVDPSDTADPSMSLECHTSLPLSSNLSCTTQEPQQSTDDETTSTLPQTSKEEPPVVQCSLCEDLVVTFSRRTEFLKHICVDHFGEEHLVNFPEFLPNDIYQQAMMLLIGQDVEN